MKKVFVLLCLSVCVPLSSQSVIALDDCLEWAQEEHPSAHQVALIDSYQKQSIKLQKRNYLPQLQLNGQATYQTDVVSLPIEFPGIDIPEVPKDQYQATLELTQMVWDGGLSRAGVEIAKAKGQVDLNQQHIDQRKVQDQTAQLFFQLILLQKQANSQELGLASLRENEQRIKAGIENGIAIPSDWSRLQLNILDLESNLAQNAKLQDQIRANLSILTGKTIDTTDSLLLPKMEVPGKAIIDRPELRLLTAQQALIDAQDQLVLSKNRPKVQVFATGGYGQPGLNFFNEGFDFFGIVGAGVQIPLAPFYTGTQKLERSQLSIQQQQLELKKEAFLQGTTLQQGLLLQQIERLDIQLKTDQEKLKLQSEIAEIASTQLENGILTVSDYLMEWNAQQLIQEQFLLHEVQRAQAIFEYRMLVGNPF